MANLFGSIQKKPKQVRVRIFIAVMMLSSVFLFFIWLFFSVGGNSVKKQDGSIKESIQLPTILESVSANLKDIFNSEDKK